MKTHTVKGKKILAMIDGYIAAFQKGTGKKPERVSLYPQQAIDLDVKQNDTVSGVSINIYRGDWQPRRRDANHEPT